MENHWKFSNIVYEQKFEQTKYNPLWFTHEAHLRLAWIYIKKYGVKVALKKYNKQLLDFAIKHKAEMKFNITVTYASIQIIHHFINKSISDNFKDFITEFPQLKINFKKILASHYSSDIFTLKNAKQQVLQPDLMAF